MTYIDGFVVPVPNEKKQAYRDLAARAAEIFKEHGALRVVECWGDDVPDGKLTDFRRAVQATADETVAFSWVEWPDKATRDGAWPEMMKDERMQPDPSHQPFDDKRMFWAGFTQIVELA